MYLFRIAFAILYGNLVCFLNKLFHWKHFYYHASIRISISASVRVKSQGKLNFGKNVSIGTRSLVSALNGGSISLGDRVSIGSDSKIVSHENVTICRGTILGSNVHIYDHDHLFNKDSGVQRKQYALSSIYIGRNSWIGANTIILRGTKIGNNCVIGAGCILKGEYPDNTRTVQKREYVTTLIKDN